MTPSFADFTDVHEVADVIMHCVGDWPGNCYSVACDVVSEGIIAGEPVYGHWLGEVNPLCKQFDPKRTFQRHGWIEGKDGLIYDYTRWVFECTKPYVWIGKNDGTYDMGGNSLRESMQRPLPDFDESQDVFEIPFEDKELKVFLYEVLELEKKICLHQIMWLSNLSIRVLREFAKPIYEWIISLNKSAFIPIDNRISVLGEKHG